MTPTFQDINELHQAAQSGLRTHIREFHIFRNEETSCHMVQKMAIHRCNFHQICLDQVSDYTLGLDSQSHKITNHKLYFIPAGTMVFWESEHTDMWAGYSIFVKSEFLGFSTRQSLDHFFCSGQPNVLPLNPQNHQQLRFFCEHMLLEQSSAFKNKFNALQHWLSLFLLACQRYYEIDLSQALPHALKVKYRFQELLNFHIEKHRDVDFYAKALHISPRHFTRLIKKASGLSPKSLIQAKLVDHAKVKLLHSPLEVNQIAHELGFTSASQFNKIFKNLCGLSPTQFRNYPRKDL